MKLIRTLLASVVGAFLVLTSTTVTHAQTTDEGATDATIVDLAVATEDLSTLVDLVTLAELVETLAGEGPFTVFAPTNDAFAELDADTVAALTADPSGALTDVLLYHVVPGKVLSSDLEDGAMVETVNGASVTVSLGDGGAMINDASVVVADVMASNGVVHIIDKVLIPPAAEVETPEEESGDTEDMEEEGTTEATIVDLAVATEDLSTLVDLVTLAELVETLAGEGPFTVFAPTNDAFAELDADTVAALTDDPSGALTNVLLYHVVPGKVLSSDLGDGARVQTVNGAIVTVTLGEDGAMINDANVVAADVMASNGVVHIIDKVLIPPAAEVETPEEESESTEDVEEEETTEATIVDLAVATEDLSTLVDLVTLAELVETLAGEGPFTVFAPTNNAFAELDADTVATLTDDPSGALTDVLLYHVVPGKVLSSDLEDGAMVETVNGESVKVSLGDDGAMINDASVVAADVMASNGVVHIIDKVLIPPAAEEESSEEESEDTEASSDDEDVIIVGTIEEVGNNGEPSDVFPLAACKGDCDGDDECGEGLTCLERHAPSDPVSIYCEGEPNQENGIDYCVPINPPTKEDAKDSEESDDTEASSGSEDTESSSVTIVGTIEEVGNAGEPSDVFPLAACKGDCDGDDECGEGLTCLERHAPSDPVSIYCEGEPDPDKGIDYCVPINPPTKQDAMDSEQLPPPDDEDDMGDMDPDMEDEMDTTTSDTIVDLAVATKDLSTLVDLVVLAELVETLAGEGPFTVFAPTNDAFAELDTETVAALTDDPSGALTDVLLYHVVPGKVLSTDLEDGAMVETANGASVEVSLGDDGAMINDAKVVAADVMASNGVVHIIDKVLIPPSGDSSESDSDESSGSEDSADEHVR